MSSKISRAATRTKLAVCEACTFHWLASFSEPVRETVREQKGKVLKDIATTTIAATTNTTTTTKYVLLVLVLVLR